MALAALAASDFALAQDGRIVNAVARQRWLGGQGVVWIVVLLVIIVALLAWIALRNRK